MIDNLPVAFQWAMAEIIALAIVLLLASIALMCAVASIDIFRKD